MKKFLALFLILVLILSFTACDDSKTPSGGDVTPSTDNTDKDKNTDTTDNKCGTVDELRNITITKEFGEIDSDIFSSVLILDSAGIPSDESLLCPLGIYDSKSEKEANLVGTTLAFTIFGNEYVLEYSETVTSLTYTLVKYSSHSEETKLSVLVDEATNQVVQISYGLNRLETPDFTEPISEELALETAVNLVRELHYPQFDPDSYSVDGTYDNLANAFSFEFTKKIGDLITEDQIYIVLDSNGSFCMSQAINAGKFDSLTVSDDFVSKISSVNKEKLESVFGKIIGFSYSEHIETVVCLPDGRFGVAISNELSFDIRGNEYFDLLYILK